MANEIELANVGHQTDVLAAIASEAFVTTDTTFPWINTQVFSDLTNVLLFPKLGKVEAGAQSESTAYSFGSDDEITDSVVTVTGAKKSQAQKISVETMRFGGRLATMERFVRAGAQAMARLAAADLKALFPSISGTITATTVLTKDNLLDARYTVASGVKNASLSPKLVGWFDFKGMNEIAKELTSTSATAFTQQVDLGLIGLANGGRPKGELFDILLFETDGLATTGGDDQACIWDPALTFCAGVDGKTGFEFRIKEPSSQEPWFELFMWAFWHIAEYNDAAGCMVRSDT